MDITQAILAIRKAQDGGLAEVGVVSEDLNRITWHDGNPTNITDQQILDKQVELRAEFDAKQYQRDRTELPERGGYPSIGDQLDDIYHNGIDGWKVTIKAIKDAHPKP
tara:strand:- start:127 stop:450 length:324 start_codon:yes stop_codon:yes gene_type:complete